MWVEKGRERGEGEGAAGGGEAERKAGEKGKKGRGGEVLSFSQDESSHFINPSGFTT